MGLSGPDLNILMSSLGKFRHFSIGAKWVEGCAPLQSTYIPPVALRYALLQPNGTHVTFGGWVRSIRRHKNVVFASIFDGSTSQDVQIVMSPVQAGMYIPASKL
jgi:hypothetical protein